MVHEFTVDTVRYILVGAVFYGGHHYMSILRDSEQRWWSCNGLGKVTPTSHWADALSRMGGRKPTHFFYVAT